MIHKLADVLTIQGDNSSGAGLGAKSRTVAAQSVGVDLTKYQGAIGWFINADTFGSSATLDAEIVESDDNVTFTALGTRVKITQLTAAADVLLETRVRNFSKRYAGLLLTPATAAVVCAAVLVAQKRSL